LTKILQVEKCLKSKQYFSWF